MQYNYDLEITKLTRQRDTLKKCAEFYADESSYDVNFYGPDEDDFEVLENPDNGIQEEAGYTARKALQDVEESENEKA